MEKRSRTWLLTFFSMIVLVLGGIASFNYYIDPLWTFPHASKYNAIQKPFDERQQKTNRLMFGKKQYDTLILGSSRMTYVNQHDFAGQAFNYSVALALTDQFNEMVEFAKKANGKEFDTIVLGLDFFSSNQNIKDQLQPITPALEKVKEPFYRYQALLSLDTLKYSLENLSYSLEKQLFPDRSYNRQNVAKAPIKYVESVKQQVQRALRKYKSGEFVYDPTFKEQLAELKKNNPNTQFIVLTTPVTAARFSKQMAFEENLHGYKQWLQDCVEIFGTVYNFMDVNSVTADLSNYFDTNHFYPHVGTMIAHRVTGTTENIPSDFGTIVTKENIQSHLQEVEQRITQYLLDYVN